MNIGSNNQAAKKTIKDSVDYYTKRIFGEAPVSEIYHGRKVQIGYSKALYKNSKLKGYKVSLKLNENLQPYNSSKYLNYFWFDKNKKLLAYTDSKRNKAYICKGFTQSNNDIFEELIDSTLSINTLENSKYTKRLSKVSKILRQAAKQQGDQALENHQIFLAELGHETDVQQAVYVETEKYYSIKVAGKTVGYAFDVQIKNSPMDEIGSIFFYERVGNKLKFKAEREFDY